MLLWYKSQKFSNRLESGGNECSLKFGFISWKCFSLDFWLGVQMGWSLLNRTWTKFHRRDSKIWEFWGWGVVLILLMDGKAVYGLVPGLSFVAGCLASWITRQERRWSAVLKIEGMQLAKNVLEHHCNVE